MIKYLFHKIYCFLLHNVYINISLFLKRFWNRNLYRISLLFSYFSDLGRGGAVGNKMTFKIYLFFTKKINRSHL